MKDVNKVILMGRLGSDPIMRETKSGASVVNFPVATTRYVRHAEDEQHQEETQWHRVVVWGKQGENCATYLKKGQPVYIEGSIRSRKYESKEGEEKVSFEVIAETVNFLPRSAPQMLQETA